ncbi:hypothetical protein [Oceanicola sp. S124]|uniref:hypothetical protein n=1 Tax=Oceanicola sp. S124 TaxID=1042378 RepID=UPI000255A435|nr:hypothetical protein [Oceanicola sp. S124]
MLELISVVALAAIGVAFTSYQGERDSSSVERRSALADADEQVQTVGIFGHDVGRRLRDRFRLLGSRHDRPAPIPREDLDEADALAARLSASLMATEETPRGERRYALDPDRTEALIAEAMAADEGSAEAGNTLSLDPLAGRSDLRASLDQGFEAPLEEAWDSSLEAASEGVQDIPAGLAGLDTAPVISDFDPERDQIVLEYRPEEAGSGRVGILTDDSHPGAALITLGGRVVAIVADGAGRVSARHVELVQEGPGKTAAA